MATTKKDPVLVVLQLTGANDYLNTIIPYNNPHYRDAGQGSAYRKTKCCQSTANWASTPTWAR